MKKLRKNPARKAFEAANLTLAENMPDKITLRTCLFGIIFLLVLTIVAVC
jgi:hypothetical protein